MAGEIARCLAELVMLDAPTLCVLLGQGTGGGALARDARRPGHLRAALVAVAAAARGRLGDPATATPSHAPELAASQRVRSLDLLADGIVDRIVAEHPDAADEPEDFCQRMSQVDPARARARWPRMDPATRLGRPAGALPPSCGS